MKPNKLSALIVSAAASVSALPLVSLPARPAPVKARPSLRSLLTSRSALTLALMGTCAAFGIHPAHAGTDTGVPDSYTLDSGAFNGVVTGAGTYLNDLIKNFGVPAILVSLAVSGWMFVRHIAKGAFH